MDLDRCNAFFLRHIFAKKERKALAIDLINSIIVKGNSEKVVDFISVNEDFSDFNDEIKFGILNVLCKTDIKDDLNIALYLKRTDGYADYDLVYWSKAYTDGIDSWTDAHKTIAITILAYNLSDEITSQDSNDVQSFHNCYKLLSVNNPKIVFTDDLQMQNVDICKWQMNEHRFDNLDPLTSWLAYLSPKTSNEKLKEIAMLNPNIKYAMYAEQKLISDPDLFAKYKQQADMHLDMGQ